MKYLFILFIISTVTIFSVNGIAIDDYHCKVPTCRDFYYVKFVFFSFFFIYLNCENHFLISYRVYHNILNIRNMLTFVMKPFMDYKAFHRKTEHVSINILEDYIRHAFVCSIGF